MQSLAPSDLSILLIEPSAMQRKVITSELNAEGISKIDTAGSGKEAIEYIKQITPDLIISSLYYPDGSATELLASIRRVKQFETLPFMLISSETRREQLESFKQSGIVAILPKPFTRNHLGMAINATIDLLSHDELELELYDVDTLRVLVVDDSSLARKVIKRVLNNLGIHQIAEAHDGSQAIQKLNSQTFDLIVTDYNMPEVNGLELAEYIRHSEQHSHLPILMVTSEANDAHLSHVSQSGVNAITDKPFEPNTVKRLLKTLLDGN